MELLANKIHPQPLAYMSPKLEDRESGIEGGGLFAKEPIRKGEILLDFAPYRGRTVTLDEGDRLYEGGFDYLFQVGDDAMIVTVQGDEPKAFGHVNHSCDPNCGIQGTYRFVAMRDIRAGEEATVDYCMFDSSKYEMKCHCGSPDCRGVVVGDDWQKPELQERYNGHFSEYLGRRIAYRNG